MHVHKFAVAPSIVICICSLCSSILAADDQPTREARPKRVLLLGQKPDSHPRKTHEYMAANRIIARLLQDRGNLQVIVVQADDDWSEGPEMIDGADAAVVFLTEGAKWVSDAPDRLSAFQRLAKRGAGLTCLHWGMGTREAAPVEAFVQLFGGCHGGPDRKYKVDDFVLTPESKPHPITSGISPFTVHDELYYDLKFLKATEVTPLIGARIGEANYPVAWAWDRSDGGRSFGFTGLHFHENWKSLEYRRLIIQGVLWTLKEKVPESGLELTLSSNDLSLSDGPAK